MNSVGNSDSSECCSGAYIGDCITIEVNGNEQCNEVSHETTPLVQEHFRSLTNALQDEFENLERKKKEVDKEADALKTEKKQMQSAVSHEDIIYLNIGGDTMSCSRATLCQVEGSLLATMFSGRWESGHKKDRHDNVFLDFNPICFKVILNYLRAKRIETPERKAKKPSPPVNEEDNFWNLAIYLGLFDEMQTLRLLPTSKLDSQTSNYNDNSCSISENKGISSTRKPDSQTNNYNDYSCSSNEKKGISSRKYNR